MQSLRDVLIDEFGLNTANWSLGGVAGISTDGRKILGNGGWLIDLDAEEILPQVHLVEISSSVVVVGGLNQPLELEHSFGEYTPATLRPGGIGLREVKGLAADGVARVGIVCYLPDPAPSEVAFELRNIDGTIESGVSGESGFLEGIGEYAYCAAADGAQRICVATQPSDRPDYPKMAVALVRAPENYVRNGLEYSDDVNAPARSISVRIFLPATPGELIAQQVVTIVRPPVVLVHGLWSDWTKWWPTEWFAKQHFWVWPLDYETTNAREFEINDKRVASQLNQAIDYFRIDQDVAAVQASAVGHSMGGILLRRVVGNAVYGRETYTKANFWQGPIDRLITIDTPHWGATSANWLLDTLGPSAEALTKVNEFLNGITPVGNRAISGGAVGDLSVGSAAIRSLPDTRAYGIPTHAIIGTGGGAAFDLIQVTGDLISEFVPPYWGATWMVVSANLDALEFLLFGSDPHDIIVGFASQRGGLTGAACSEFGFGLEGAGVHTTVNTSEQRVAERVMRLLNLPPGAAEYAKGFPSVPQLVSTRATYLAPARSVGSIVIDSPPNGQLVAPGEHVQFLFHSSDGQQIANGTLFGGNGTAKRIDAGAIATAVIPLDLVGSIKFGIIGNLPGGQAGISNVVELRVRPEAPLLGIHIEPESYELSEEIDRVPITVIGNYADGIQREIGSESYSVFVDDVRVASVFAGDVTAANAGKAHLVVKFEGFTAVAPVVVNSAPQPQCVGDVNGDEVTNVIDFKDMIVFLGFSSGARRNEGDLNGDDSVNVKDFNILASDFGCSH